MKLTFLFAPVRDLAAALPFYRDELGLEEAWREGTRTVAFQLPDSEVQLMVDDENSDPPGPMYLVDDLTAFMAAHPDLPVVAPRYDIPGGSVIGYRDPGGNAFYVFDTPDAG